MHKRQIGTALFFSLAAAAAAGDEPAAPATSAPAWVERSNADAQVLLKVIAEFRPEFASRIGVSAQDLAAYLDGSASPSAALMIRIRRLSDRFVKVKSARSGESN